VKYRLSTSRQGAEQLAQKAVSLAPGQSVTLCDATGSGRVVRLWCTLPLWGRRAALNQLVLRAFWDGEVTPSIDVPVGAFFGASFGQPRRLISSRLVVAGGAVVSRFEMPFNSGARLEVVNDSTE
jgi:hypothetical protein